MLPSNSLASKIKNKRRNQRPNHLFHPLLFFSPPTIPTSHAALLPLPPVPRSTLPSADISMPFSRLCCCCCCCCGGGVSSGGILPFALSTAGSRFLLQLPQKAPMPDFFAFPFLRSFPPREIAASPDRPSSSSLESSNLLLHSPAPAPTPAPPLPPILLPKTLLPLPSSLELE